jgi:hypothetical protein
MGEAAPSGPATVEVSPETARLEQEAMELAEEASALQSRAEGLQVTAHTSDPEPAVAAAQAEALEAEAQDLAAKVEAMADPVETPDRPTARPATVVGTYRAMGGALVAAADALDAVAEVVQHKVVASQPEAAEHSPVAQLESDLAAAVGIGEHHGENESEDEAIHFEMPDPISEDEAPLPTSEEVLLFPEEPLATEPAVAEPVATEPTIAEPAAAEPASAERVAAEPVVTEPVTAEPVAVEPVAAEPVTAGESPTVDASPLLLKAVNLRSKAEALRTRGEGLLTKADALKAAAGVADEELEAGEDGQGGEYALHGDWAAAGLGPAAGGAAGQSAGVATAGGGTAMPFPITPRKQRKPKSVVREFISIVAGGVTALVLTYIILLFVGDQYDFLGIRKCFSHKTKSETGTQTGPEKSSKAAGKEAKSSSPATPGHGAQVARAGGEKQAAGKLELLPGLPEAKPTPLDSPSGDNVPTTLPSGDTLPGTAVSPAKPAESEPEPPAADAKFGKVVDMLKPPAYGSDEIGWALKNAQDAFQGDLKPGNYLSLCRLAEAVTFIDPQKGVAGLSERKAAAEKLLRDVGERDKHKNVKVIAQLADKWLDNRDRECAGVLLAGRIQKIGKNSHGTTIAIVALAKPDKSAPAERTIKMLSQEPLDLQEKDAVIILGGLGVGGQGDRKELVVVHGMTVKFAVPAAKP